MTTETTPPKRHRGRGRRGVVALAARLGHIGRGSIGQRIAGDAGIACHQRQQQGRAHVVGLHALTLMIWPARWRAFTQSIASSSSLPSKPASSTSS